MAEQNGGAHICDRDGVKAPGDVRELVAWPGFSCEEHAALRSAVFSALDVLIEALERFGIEGIAFSWNGGKDSTATLHLHRMALYLYAHRQEIAPEASGRMAVIEAAARSEAQRLPPSGTELVNVPTIFFVGDDMFEEIRSFTRHSARVYSLDVVELREASMKEELRKFLGEHREVKSVVLGTRSTDPWSENLKPFTPSSTESGWPRFTRVLPILPWSYCVVWQFLRALSLEYCTMYDEGYTSIGSKACTLPNPALRRPDGTFAPAYTLTQQDLERDGRT